MKHMECCHIREYCTRLVLRVAVVLNITLLVLLSAFPSIAQAKDADMCENIGENPEWIRDMQEFAKAVDDGELNHAQTLSQKLSKICENTPVLNYVQGKMYEKLGDKTNALYYYQKASDNTYRYAVEPSTAKKIWFTRYEFENPERTKEAVSIQKETIDELQTENYQKVDALASYKDEHYREISKTLWTGTGLGIGGLVMIGTGAALAAVYPACTIEQKNGGKLPYVVQEKALHSAGWAFIGVGAGLVVSGTVLAGIYGYKYTHFKTENTDISFQLSPASLSFGMTF